LILPFSSHSFLVKKTYLQGSSVGIDKLSSDLSFLVAIHRQIAMTDYLLKTTEIFTHQC